MMGSGSNMRVGPICRTVEDTARMLDAIAGYDPKDELTAFSVGRKPAQPYSSFDRRTPSRWRPHRRACASTCSRALLTMADDESIDLIERALGRPA